MLLDLEEKKAAIGSGDKGSLGSWVAAIAGLGCGGRGLGYGGRGLGCDARLQRDLDLSRPGLHRNLDLLWPDEGGSVAVRISAM